jgi:hypothetical protein
MRFTAALALAALFVASTASVAHAQPEPEPAAPESEPAAPPEAPAEAAPAAEQPPAEPAPEPQAEPPPREAPAPDPALPPLEPAQPPPPPPEPQEPDKGFTMPPWSVRLDPFNWVLEGRLGLELEVGLLDFMTVELVPVFVVSDRPPTLNLDGAPDVLHQESNGIGPISGASLDVGFWLDGTAFHGYVIRVGITNYGYTYDTKDADGAIDSVDVTERVAFAMFGSQVNWGAFTLAGGIGLGIHLNRQERCFPAGATSTNQAVTSGCDQELAIATSRDPIEAVDLNGGLYPAELVGRFSLGILID